MSKNYLTVVYEIDENTTAREILDAHLWTASSYSHAIQDRDAARLEIASLNAQMEAVGAGGVEPLRQPSCWCESCDAAANHGQRSRMSLCPQCGNKRCPRAKNHTDACANAALATAPAQPVAPDFDVSTTAGGRGYVAWFFSNVMRRYDFNDYINNALAADFACALARWLSTAHQPPAQAQDKDEAKAQRLKEKRWLEVGKAIERACETLPEWSEVIVSLENGAGSVKWFDGDGNEHDSDTHGDCFSETINNAIEAAIAAQQGGPK